MGLFRRMGLVHSHIFGRDGHSLQRSDACLDAQHCAKKRFDHKNDTMALAYTECSGECLHVTDVLDKHCCACGRVVDGVDHWLCLDCVFLENKTKIAGFFMTKVIAFSKLTLVWYGHQWLVVPFYVLPMISALHAVHSAVAKRVFQKVCFRLKTTSKRLFSLRMTHSSSRDAIDTQALLLARVCSLCSCYVINPRPSSSCCLLCARC